MSKAASDEIVSFSYEDRILAYVDILGWKDTVERSSKDRAGLISISKALSSLADVEARVRTMRQEAERDGRVGLALEATLFSDTVVLSCRPDHRAITVLIAQLQWFCSDLMLAGIYTRGAIVRGQLHHTAREIVGPALIDAHKLESTVAKYPRILISDPVLLLMVSISRSVGTPSLLPVEQDVDMLTFLNLFVGMAGSLEEQRMRIYEAQLRVYADLQKKEYYEDPGVRSKLGWLLKFLSVQLDKTPRQGEAGA